MRTMNTGFVTILVERHAETTQVLFRRHTPASEFIVALTDGEIDRLIDLIKPKAKGE